MTTTTTTNGSVEKRKLETLEEFLAWVEELDTDGTDLRPLCETLVREKFQLAGALSQLREFHEALRAEVEALVAPEQYPVVITAVHDDPLTVEVAAGGGRLRVSVHPDVPRESLRVGSRGLLSQKRNCLLQVFDPRGEFGDVGVFEGYLPDQERMLLRHQEQLLAVGIAQELRATELKKGDLVGFDRDSARLAYRKVEQPDRQDLFFEDTPADRFDELGGLDEEIARLKWVVEFRLLHGAVAARYKLKAKRGILLEGPPGNGKTKLARCLARFVAERVPAGRCQFMAIAGSADYSMWLGQSEQKLIARFQAARQVATQSRVPVVMFFDEIDAIGRRRGADLGSSAPDRILATLLAQLDGMQQVDNLIVIGATNRADVLDPGLVRPGRLGDFKVRIPAPGRGAAEAILGRYLAGLPLASEQDRLVRVLLSKLYAERGEYAEVARVALRDGRKVTVRGRDLISGAVLENVVRRAAEDAADREARGGSMGLGEDDLSASLDAELRGAATLLTPGNVRGYVTRLPGDVEPVGVEALLRGPGLGRYVRAS